MVIAALAIVLMAAALGLVLTELQKNQAASPNLPATSNPPASTPSAANPSPTATIPPTPISFTPAPTSSSTPLPTPSQATTANGTFELTVSVDKTVYGLGEQVNVTLTIVNISNQTVEFTRTGMDFDFTVTDSASNLVYQWSIGQAVPQFIAIEQFTPGENETATYVWPQTQNTPAPSGIQVPAGTYFIVGKSSAIYGLQTSPLQITIAGS